MTTLAWPDLLIRTAVAPDLPELQRVYREASLSNAGDAPLLLAHPEFLVFAGEGLAGEGLAEGRTRVAVPPARATGRVLGFATVTPGPAGGPPDLEDLFVDPCCRRQGIARRLVLDAVRTARSAGHDALTVTGNPHALAFYHAVGFVEIGEVATALGRGRRLLLDLTSPSE